MIPLARPTISPVAITILTWNLFCFWEVGTDGRTDTTYDNSDHHQSWQGQPRGSISVVSCKIFFAYYTTNMWLSRWRKMRLEGRKTSSKGNITLLKLFHKYILREHYFVSTAACSHRFLTRGLYWLLTRET